MKRNRRKTNMNAIRGNILPIISACSIGIGAYLGAKYERLRSQPYQYDKSSFPWIIPAKAAAPIHVPYSGGDSAMNSNISVIMRYGYPSLDNVRVFDDYVLSYDRRNRNAHWVFEHLTPDKLPHAKDKQAANRENSRFYEDEKIHETFRSLLRDFKGSGFDRGHLAAAGNHRHSQLAMDQTFALSNISPQVGEGFNRGIWNDLEKYIRSIARKNRNTYICTGPLYLPRKEEDGKRYIKYEVIGRNNVAVPTHFFKVILIENSSGNFEILSFVIPNVAVKDVRLKTFLTPIDAVERAAGFLLFDKIPKSKISSVNGQKSGWW